MSISMSPEEKSYYEHLAKIMLKTRGARFTAAHALSFQERFSIFTTALLSVFVLAWSVWLVATPTALPAGDVQILGALSIIASVAILVLTLLDYTQGRTLRADKLQQNALRISMLMRSLERELCSPTCDVGKIRDIAQQYEQSISETQINHEPVHFRKWELDCVRPEKLHHKVWHFLVQTIFSVRYFFSPLLVHLGVIMLILGGLAWFLWLR